MRVESHDQASIRAGSQAGGTSIRPKEMLDYILNFRVVEGSIKEPTGLLSIPEEREHLLVSTPKMSEAKGWHASNTPNSLIEKMGHLSPEETTIQKRVIDTPISMSLWKKVDSSLKKSRHLTSSPQGSLFQNSDQKGVILPKHVYTMAPVMEPSYTMGEGLHFPDLENNHYDYPFWNRISAEQQFAKTLYPFENIGFGEERAQASFALPLDTKQEARKSEEGCNCRNTKCLKLYCECLRKGNFCNNCNCTGCENHATSDYRKERVRVIEKKNPHAFKPIIVADKNNDKMKIHNKGCNCRRSNCLKNYCECHQFGVLCSEYCKCFECKNLKKEGQAPRAKRTEEGKENRRGKL